MQLRAGLDGAVVHPARPYLGRYLSRVAALTAERRSELCATCHTLFTQALDPQGTVVGELPEQVPYQEWLHSAFRGARSCQSCHMPAVAEKVRISSVFGEPREGF